MNSALAFGLTSPIPEMVDPLGRYWKQPDRSDIMIDDTHARMSRATFEKLANYSATNPSGVYVGKMWRGLVDRAPGREPYWVLRWFGHDPEPGFCSNHQREIIIT